MIPTIRLRLLNLAHEFAQPPVPIHLPAYVLLKFRSCGSR